MRRIIFLTFLLTICKSLFASATLLKPKVDDYFSFSPDQLGERISSKFLPNGKFDYRPELLVNTNRGSFQTKFQIPFPKNVPAANILYFNYSSENMLNIGYGVGWNLNLPKIYRNITNPEESFLIEGALGNFEIIKTNEDPLSLLRSKNDLKNNDIVKTYRPTVDNGDLIFFKVTRSNKIIQWLAQNSKNDFFQFNSEGKLEYTHNASGRGYRIQYHANKLHNIQFTHENLSYDFIYKNTEVQYFIYQGKLQKFEHALKEIIINKDGNKNTVSLAYHKDKYLEKVSSRDMLLSLFQGKYKTVKFRDKKTQLVKAIDHNKAPIFFNRDEVEWRDVPQKKNKITYLIDINSDGRHDIVTLNLNKAITDLKTRLSKIKHIILGESAEDCIAHVYNKPLDNEKKEVNRIRSLKWTNEFFGNLNVSIEYDIATLENGIFKYKRDQNLTQNIKMKDFLNYQVTHKWTSIKGCNKVEYHDFSFSIPQLHYSDFNHDGYKDLLICKSQHDYDARISKLTDTEKRNLKFNSILRELSHPDTKHAPFPNVLKDRAEKAKFFLYKKNHKKIKYMSSSTVSENYVHNSASYIEMPTKIKCHKNTLFHDVNRDGIADIVTKDQVLLNSPFGEEQQVLNTGLKTYFNIDKKQFSYDISNKEYTIINMPESNALTVLPRAHFYYDIFSGEYVTISDSEQIISKPAPYRKLLHKTTSPFGGVTEIKYKWQNGIVVVDKKIEDSKTKHQPIKTITYDYINKLKDTNTGTYLGFAHTKEKVTSNSGQEDNYIIEKKYYKDFVPDTYLYQSRARLNGTQLSQARLGAKGNLLESDSYHLGYINLGANRIRTYFPGKERIYFDNTGNETKVASKNELTNWLTNINDLGEELKILPKSHIVTTTFPNISGNLFSEPQIKIEKTDFEYDQTYALSTISSIVEDKDQKLLKSPSKRVWKEGLLVSETENEVTSTFNYDTSSRLTDITNTKGYKAFITYPSKSNSVLQINNPFGLFNVSKDIISGKETEITWLNNTIKSTYTLDEHLLSKTLTRDLKTSSLFQLDDILGRFIRYTQKGIKTEVLLDGFGRPIQAAEEGKTLNTLSLKYVLGTNDSSIATLNKNNQTIDLMSYNERNLLKRVSSENDKERVQWIENDGKCSRTEIEGIVFEFMCKDIQGNKVSHQEQGIDYFFDYDLLNQLVGLNPNEYQWDYDSTGSINYSEGSKQYLGVGNWQDYNQQTDNNKNLSIESYDGITVRTQKDSTDRVSTEKADSPALINKSITYKAHKIDTISLDYDGDQIKTKNFYDNDRIDSVSTFGIDIDFDYDEYSQIVKQTYSKGNKQLFSVHNTIESELVTNIVGVTSNIEYDNLRNLKSISTLSGLSIKFKYENSSSILKNMTYEHQSGLKYIQDIKNNELRRIEKVETNHNLNENNFNLVDEFDYDNFGRLNIASPQTTRQKPSKIGSADLKYSGPYLHKIRGNTEQKLFYDAGGNLNSICRGNSNPSVDLNNCMTLLDSDTAIIEGYVVKMVRVQNYPVGVYINKNFFPVISDYKGSIVSILSTDAKAPLISRTYDHWGNRTTKLHTKHFNGARTETDKKKILNLVDRLIIWSFAGLKTSPFEENEQLYFSQTRAYSPNLKHWLTIDPLVVKNPSKLLSQPGNWNNLTYCNNDPINFIDPSGQNIFVAGAVVIGGAALYLTGPAILAGAAALGGTAIAIGSVVGGAILAGAALYGLGSAVYGLATEAYLLAGSTTVTMPVVTKNFKYAFDAVLGYKTSPTGMPNGAELLGMTTKYIVNNYQDYSFNFTDELSQTDNSAMNNNFSFGDYQFNVEIGTGYE